MPARTPHYNESKAVDREIRDRLQSLCNLSITLQTLYFNGASSATVISTAQDMEQSLAELRSQIAKYDEIENV